MTDFSQVNANKIKKVVYMLLQKYHRSHGVAVVGWSQPPASHYFSFYLLGVRNTLGRPFHLTDGLLGSSLTIYQDQIGMPAWGVGEQIEHPSWRSKELRSAELLKWYEEQICFTGWF